LTVRQLAAAAGVHHTYVSKLERGDRQAPDAAVVEALAAALGATPAQVDQLRWRAGLAPRGGGAPGQDDATLTLVAEAIGDPALSAADRARLRRTIAQAVEIGTRDKGLETSGDPGLAAGFSSSAAMGARSGPPASSGHTVRHTLPSAAAPRPSVSAAPAATPSLVPEAPPDGRGELLAGLLGGWQTLDEAAAELRVASAYLWDLVQSGHLKAWALPGAGPGSPAGVRLRREDVLGLLRPIAIG
jgi:transcriptional regulator with XRE-family HTH domain